MRACDFLNTKTKTQSNSNYLNILKKYFLRRSQTNVTQNKIKTNKNSVCSNDSANQCFHFFFEAIARRGKKIAMNRQLKKKIAKKIATKILMKIANIVP